MHAVRKYIFFLLLIGLFWASCKKDSASPQTSALSASPLKVNTDSIGFGLPGKYSNWIPLATYKNNILTIGGYSNPTPGQPSFAWSFYMKFYAKTTGTYLLSTKDTGCIDEVEYMKGSVGAFAYYTDSVYTGKVILTELDTIHHLASGTFWYAIRQHPPYLVYSIDSIQDGVFANITW